ncbi:MAG: hypothetical protein LBC71_03335, partial [Oscillospiraceae bacterium]|nr:hypothetical protein [Oscillospiraceae bacterium]
DLDNYVTAVTNDARIYMPLSELVDINKERERLNREITKAKAEVQKTESKLANTQFTDKAPPAVVQAERDKLEKHKALLANLQESLKQMHNA